MAKQRIAIVGGGPGGLSTAFHLTQEPGWQDKYDICIYQLGWRVGGKGATGRDDAAGFRILEHGIHGFCNCYFNTWAMMKEAYGGLTAADKKLMPVTTMEQAFLPSSLTYQLQYANGQWHTEEQEMPATEGYSWDAPPPPMNWQAIIKGLLEHMRRRGRPGALHHLKHSDLVHPNVQGKQKQSHRKGISKLIHNVVKGLHEKAHALEDDAIEVFLTLAVKELDGMRKVALTLAGDLNREFDMGHSVALATLDMYWTTLKGILEDKLWTKDLDSIDEQDFRQWLGRHGALESTLTSSIAFVVPNIMFSYPDGDSTNPPVMSATSWLSWLLRSIIGRGDYFYFMAAGTGESAILPVYLALKRRGVRFEFFHKLVGVKTGTGANKAVEQLQFERQATVNGNAQYDPLQPVPGKKWRVWPMHPLWQQLKFGEQNRAAGVNYERWGQVASKGSGQRTLTRGRAGKDGFDYVVWAMPPTLLPLVGNATMQKSWSGTVGSMTTTATQASQVWLSKSTADLGWPIDKKKYGKTARYISGSFPNPLNCMSVFDDLIEFENWGAKGPQGLIYFCSQMHHIDNELPTDLGRTMAHTSSQLRVLGEFLTGAQPTGLDRNEPQAIDFDFLHVPQPAAAATGEARLAHQYHRSNTDPTEAYVQALPGSAKHRMLPWDSGFSNLVPAGDWMYTGINIGAFESAVSGGKFAAFALTGYLRKDQVYGIDFLHKKISAAIDKAQRNGAVPVLK